MKSILLALPHRPCQEALDWVGDRSPEDAWAECKDGSQMLWLAAIILVDLRIVVRAACACARLALVLLPAKEERPRIAIETAERWCDGRATAAEVRNAANAAADAAADAAHSADATHAASADAAANAAAVAYSADAATYASRAAADAAAAAADLDTLAQCADIVRRYIPFEAIEAKLVA